MTPRVDTLAERTSLRSPLAGSVTMHGVMCAMIMLYSWAAARGKVRIGNPNAQPGGAVPINIASGIPLAPAQTVVTNPVATGTRSAVPSPPETGAPEPKAEPPDPQAMPLPGPKTKAGARRTLRSFRSYVPDRDNQLYSARGQDVNTPSYTGLSSDAFGVGIGTGTGSPFGARFGWYSEALQRKLGQQWQLELAQVDRRIPGSPRSMVFFEIQLDGSLKNIRVVQSSGVSAVDYAALRAVTNAGPVAPLPRDLGRSSVSIEVSFQLQR